MLARILFGQFHWALDRTGLPIFICPSRVAFPKARLTVGLLSFLTVVTAHPATFYCDPTQGSPQGDGSTDRPWGTIEEVLQAKQIQICDSTGNPANPSAPVKPGDTILLRSGWHGILRVPRSYNDQPITLAAQAGHTPQAGWVQIEGGRKWCVKGLTVSPSLAPKPLEHPPHNLVMLGEQGGEDSSELVVEDCWVSPIIFMFHMKERP
ncbi:MAG TPA: hypothetical protein P5055_18480 [Candidatus Paceibacterota bacterium]|nr:hypothetical protein [Candidatus Paceibacterota bacterium]